MRVLSSVTNLIVVCEIESCSGAAPPLMKSPSKNAWLEPEGNPMVRRWQVRDRGGIYTTHHVKLRPLTGPSCDALQQMPPPVSLGVRNLPRSLLTATFSPAASTLGPWVPTTNNKNGETLSSPGLMRQSRSWTARRGSSALRRPDPSLPTPALSSQRSEYFFLRCPR